jgi:hypothetical protein
MKTTAKIFIILILLVPAPLLAETFPEIDVEKIFVEKKAFVKDFLQLSEQESAVFWPLYDEYEKLLVTRFKRYKTLIRDYMQEHKHLSDKKAQEMTATLMDIQVNDLKNKHAYVKKFREKLPPKRVFQYFVLEDQIGAGFFAMILENLPPIK